MKFLALALALLLAVGSQAASLQADAPSQLAHAFTSLEFLVTQSKDSLKRIMDQLDDTEYKELKTGLQQRLDNGHAQLQALLSAALPVTENVVNTVSEVTADFRTSLKNDYDQLKADLEPKVANLRSVLRKHFDEYSTIMGPVVKDYRDRQMAEMEALRSRVEPLLADLQSKVSVNVEETKTALMPIVEAVKTKLSEHLQNGMDMAKPYMAEYREQMKHFFTQSQNVNMDDINALRQKIQPLIEDIKTKVQAIIEAVASTLSKN